MTPSHRQFRIAKHVHAREFAGELVLLDLAGGRYFSLDDLGTRIWREIEQGKAVAAIVEEIVRDYAAEADQVVTDVNALVDDLVGKGLLETDLPSESSP